MDYGQLPNRVIICIDMKSFFASVSSVIRGLNPLKTRLAVYEISNGRDLLC